MTTQKAKHRPTGKKQRGKKLYRNQLEVAGNFIWGGGLYPRKFWGRAEAVRWHCLQFLTPEIKIWKFRTIHLLILDKYVSWWGLSDILGPQAHAWSRHCLKCGTANDKLADDENHHHHHIWFEQSETACEERCRRERDMLTKPATSSDFTPHCTPHTLMDTPTHRQGKEGDSTKSWLTPAMFEILKNTLATRQLVIL